MLGAPCSSCPSPSSRLPLRDPPFGGRCGVGCKYHRSSDHLRVVPMLFHFSTSAVPPLCSECPVHSSSDRGRHAAVFILIRVRFRRSLAMLMTSSHGPDHRTVSHPSLPYPHSDQSIVDDVDVVLTCARACPMAQLTTPTITFLLLRTYRLSNLLGI